MFEDRNVNIASFDAKDIYLYNHNNTTTQITLLNKKGHIVVTIYPGHSEGLKESVALKKYLQSMEYIYDEYHNTDNNTAPYVINIKQKKS